MKQFRFKLLAAAFLMLPFMFLTSCHSGKVKKDASDAMDTILTGNITLSGAFALYPMAVRWADEFKKINPGVKIDISGGGAGKGMMDALSKMVDLGMVSREIKDEEKAKGAWSLAVVKDAVLPTINASNPVLKELKTKGVPCDMFKEIFITENIKNWGKVVGTKNNAKVNVYTRSDACGAAETWAQYLGKKQEDLQGVGVNADPGMADAIKNDKLGIGYNNVNYAFDSRTKQKYPGIEIVPIDINNNGILDPDENIYNNIDEVTNAVANGKYPSPPARDLYLVANGKPQTKLVLAFLKWILTDGQKFVPEAGYVNLTEEKINSELQKLQ
jgi:phosphate transport system substrate-binding protein